MTNEQHLQVSVISPVSLAVDRVKMLLFSPFDLGKWMLIGFCAWISMLDKGGFNFNMPLKWEKDFSSSNSQLEYVKEFVTENLPLIIPIACIIVVAVIIIWIVLLWLSSRGHFMFLDCIACNKAEVKKPWKEFRAHGNSLFVFRLVLQVVGPLALLLVVALPIALLCFLTGCIEVKAVSVIFCIVGVFIFIAFLIALVLAAKFTIDFAVPLMYRTNQGCLAAWRILWGLIKAYLGNFVLYVLFQIVIHVAVGAILMILTCATCCVAGCIMALPYLGAVFLLPILVFVRSYSLYYIRQYGPEFDVFGSVETQSTQ
jgi:hypothetical protein